MPTARRGHAHGRGKSMATQSSGHGAYKLIGANINNTASRLQRGLSKYVGDCGHGVASGFGRPLALHANNDRAAVSGMDVGDAVALRAGSRQFHIPLQARKSIHFGRKASAGGERDGHGHDPRCLRSGMFRASARCTDVFDLSLLDHKSVLIGE
jgi:hypothetical protein